MEIVHGRKGIGIVFGMWRERREEQGGSARELEEEEEEEGIRSGSRTRQRETREARKRGRLHEKKKNRIRV